MSGLSGAVLVRTGFKPRSQRMARSGTLARSPFVRKAKSTQAGPAARMTSHQREPTKVEKLLWTRMAAVVGCIACHLDGHPHPVVSIHHIDGRTKPGCHGNVLPLCAGHHQDKTGEDKSLIAVHPYKARFERRYGAQLALLDLVHQLLAGAEAPCPALPTLEFAS